MEWRMWLWRLVLTSTWPRYNWSCTIRSDEFVLVDRDQSDRRASKGDGSTRDRHQQGGRRQLLQLENVDGNENPPHWKREKKQHRSDPIRCLIATGAERRASISRRAIQPVPACLPIRRCRRASEFEWLGQVSVGRNRQGPNRTIWKAVRIRLRSTSMGAPTTRSGICGNATKKLPPNIVSGSLHLTTPSRRFSGISHKAGSPKIQWHKMVGRLSPSFRRVIRFLPVTDTALTTERLVAPIEPRWSADKSPPSRLFY